MADFEIVGPASAGRVRAAALLDLLVAAVVSMLILPQPVIRAVLIGTNATVPRVSAFVLTMVGAVVLVYWLYLAFSAVTWGRSPSMYLLDLGLEAPSKPTLSEAAMWASAWVVAALPALIGVRSAYEPETGMPARWSGLSTRAARNVSRPDSAV